MMELAAFLPTRRLWRMKRGKNGAAVKIQRQCRMNFGHRKSRVGTAAREALETAENLQLNIFAGVMELADVTDSKSVGLITRAGSTPAAGTKIDGRK